MPMQNLQPQRCCRRWRLALAALLLLTCSLPGCGDDGSTANPLDGAALASRPPMGWNSWNHFHCSIDEQLIRETADAMVSSGMREAGYLYVNIDDCWQAYERDADGTPRSHPDRFPSGIRALAEYVHQRGLRLGIYATPGTRTCDNIFNHYPGKLGSLGHEEQDARVFADWGIDYLKYDWCLAEEDGLEKIPAFTKMGQALRATGRPIVYSISEYGDDKPWIWGRSTGAHLWRTSGDILDWWGSVAIILGRQGRVTVPGRPQAWNDLDILQVGNGGMSAVEYRMHFSMWSIMSAPLLAGNDVRRMSEATREILLNREVIAVNQDWGGKAGFKVRDDGSTEVWAKPLSDGSVAAALVNMGEQTVEIAVTASGLGLPAAPTFVVRDLWGHNDGASDGTIRAAVAAHGVALYRVRVK